MKKMSSGALICIFLMILGWSVVLAETLPITIERVGVVPEGRFALNTGLSFEMGRESEGLEYDNLRLLPNGMRYGLGDSLEIGGFFAMSMNFDDDRGAPDENGLEGLTLFGKISFNEFIALQAGLTILGDADIMPYSNDGIDLFVNVPLQRRAGPGMIFGEFGYLLQGGDFDDCSYFNFGVGYGMPLNNHISLNIELKGEDAHKYTNNTLDLLMGVSIVPSKNLRIAPYLSAGLYDDSPDVASGIYLDVIF
jgi:hypothetical protein